MNVSYNWLQNYIVEKLPLPLELATALTSVSYEVEEIVSNENDTIFSIDILPNRSSDSLGHKGVAREVAAACNLTIKEESQGVITYPNVSNELSVTINPKVARRAIKRIVRGVKVGESPQWLKDALSSIGQRSISNVVDITNFVMWETGNPVHAFDADKVNLSSLEVRFAAADESIIALDGVTYELNDSIPVIADRTGPMDVAGIKGGSHTCVDETTSSLLLSVCSFTPALIRRSSRSLGLRTDASKRFENNVPPASVSIALERLTSLIVDICGGEVMETVDVYPYEKKLYKVGINAKEVMRIIGIDLDNEIIERLLQKVGIVGEWKNPQQTFREIILESVGTPYKYGASVLVDAPAFFDCSSLVAYAAKEAGLSIPRMTIDQCAYAAEILKEDLEIGDLIFSQDSADSSKEEFVDVDSGKIIEQYEVKTITQEYMPGTDLGYGVSHIGVYVGDGNIVHASGPKTGEGKVIIEELTSSKKFQTIRKYGRIFLNADDRYVATIPYWRTDITGPENLIEEIARLYGLNNIPRTELSDFSTPDHVNSYTLSSLLRSLLINNGAQEVLTYSFRKTGDIELAHSLSSDKSFLRTNLIEGMGRALELNNPQRELFLNQDFLLFEIGKVYTSKGEELHLSVGIKPRKGNGEKQIQSIISKILESIPGLKEVFEDKTIENGVIEINLENISTSNILPEIMFPEVRNTGFKQFSSHPFIVRDIAFWATEKVTEQEMNTFLKEEAGEFAQIVRCFDTFEKDGKTSYGYRIIFQSFDRTLTDEEINPIMERVYKLLNKKGFEIR